MGEYEFDWANDAATMAAFITMVTERAGRVTIGPSVFTNFIVTVNGLKADDMLKIAQMEYDHNMDMSTLMEVHASKD